MHTVIFMSQPVQNVDKPSRPVPRQRAWVGFNLVILQEQTCLEWLCILRDLLDCNVVFQTVCVLLSLNVGTPGMAVRALLASWIESGEGCGVVVEKTVRYLQQNTTAPAQRVTIAVTTAFTTPQQPMFFLATLKEEVNRDSAATNLHC